MNVNPRNSNGDVYYNDSNNGNLSVYRYSNSLLNDSTLENEYNESGNLNALNTAFYGPGNDSGNEEEDVGNRLLPDEVNLNATLPTGGRRSRRVRNGVVKRVAKRLVKKRKSHKATRKASRRTTRKPSRMASRRARH